MTDNTEALQRFIKVKRYSDNKMEAARHSHSSMSLVPRLDHLDFVVSLSFPKHLRSHTHCLSVNFLHLHSVVSF